MKLEQPLESLVPFPHYFFHNSPGICYREEDIVKTYQIPGR